MTYTYVVMEVSDDTYTEIADKLREAGYSHVFNEHGVIDMNGLALAPEKIKIKKET